MKTVKVRIAVAVNSAGEWDSHGDSDERPEYGRDRMTDLAWHVNHGDPGAPVAFYWIEAELPLPAGPQTVAGTVTEGEPE
jgi:hypothetical protein